MVSLRLVPSFGAPIDIVRDQAIVGREPSCDVAIEHGSISRRHARLERRGAAWFVVDEGSANGTYLDSMRVTESPLRDLQELRFGAVSFRVVMATAGVTPGATVLSGGGAPPVHPSGPPPVYAPSPPSYPPAMSYTPPAVPARPPAHTSPPPPPPIAPGRPARPVHVGSAAPAPAPAKKGRGPFFWVGLGCGGCLVVVLLGFGGIAGGAWFMTRGARTVVDAQLGDIRDGKLDAARDRFTAETKGRVSAQAFAAFVARHPGLKENKDATFLNRNYRNDAASLGGTLQATSGAKETVRYELVKEGGAWKIAEIVVGDESASGSALIARARGPAALVLGRADVGKRREGNLTRVLVSAEATGFQVRPESDGYAIDLALDVETLGPDGLRMEALSRADVQRYIQRTSLETGGVAAVSTPLLLDPGALPGLYTVRLTVRDLVGGAQADTQVQFQMP
jgi:hypothetical protein